MKRIFLIFLLLFTIANPIQAEVKELINNITNQHPGKTGSYLLDQGLNALIARAWLTENAKESIDIQYFIWSTDHVGILATEALLSAAERGVKVRVIVDDFMLKANPKDLLALNQHPLIEIKIYNPVVRNGVSTLRKYYNLLTNFKKFNQRMHDKTFVVDGVVGITGGRNMADEYFDFDNKYTFRDRDIILIGEVVTNMKQSFQLFWESHLSVPIDNIYPVEVPNQEVKRIYEDLHSFAKNRENYPENIRDKIDNLDQHFQTISSEFLFGDAKWLFDLPGKNQKTDLSGGGLATANLIEALKLARRTVLIQSPYLVFDPPTIEFFKTLIDKGVTITISTNSLESTDNIAAFAGYHKRRKQLLRLGIQIFEFKARPKILASLMQRFDEGKKKPIFAIHAKSIVIDRNILYIGTFNLDPRSINLNTEVGVLIYNPKLARQLNTFISLDIAEVNSYDLRKVNPDRHVPGIKRLKVWLLKLLPLEKIL